MNLMEEIDRYIITVTNACPAIHSFSNRKCGFLPECCGHRIKAIYLLLLLTLKKQLSFHHKSGNK